MERHIQGASRIQLKVDILIGRDVKCHFLLEKLETLLGLTDDIVHVYFLKSNNFNLL